MFKRAAAVLPVAIALTLGAAPSTQASSDCTDYSDDSGAKAVFAAYGEHLYVTDEYKDGYSAIGRLELYYGEDYYYWNTNGAGTTKHFDLSFAEDRVYNLGAYLGNWDGTVTGGIDFNSNNVIPHCNGTT
ncbi:hypothetical protein ACIQPS_33210 [Streptomyces sp. NPDC091290]|uniref:hypothetical protein n=1 Tax=Streptomyces sp. NPDC091290 TaxID=3365990 RepID=UPI003824DB9B